MKIFINDTEIKTILKGVSIQGSLSSASRIAKFEFVYSPLSDIPEYRVKIGSNVLISDNNMNVFKGEVIEIVYIEEQNIIKIQAQDYVSLLLKTYVKGRYQGSLFEIISKVLGGFNFNLGVDLNKIKQSINIVSFGNLTAFDVITSALYALYKDDFKLYTDGYSNLKVLFPLVSKSSFELDCRKNVVSSMFKADVKGGFSKITIRDVNSYIVAGDVIKLVDFDKKISGEFVVEDDCHIFSDTHLVTLTLKERGEYVL